MRSLPDPTVRRSVSSEAAFLVLPVLFAAGGSLSCTGARGDLDIAVRGEDLVTRRGTFTRTALLTGELRAVDAANVPVPRLSAGQVQIRWMEEDGIGVVAGQRIIELDQFFVCR